MKYVFYIGIDPGTSTGIAIWDAINKCFISVETVKIDIAMERVLYVKDTFFKEKIFVRFEDAKLRKWFGNAGREKLQGAGSIKRDCVIWNDFLTRKQIQFEAVAPKNNKTKLSSKAFKEITKYEGKTSEHSRDAAMLVFGIKY
jgi:hypothetical protein